MKYSLAILSLLYFFSACVSLKQKENIDSVESEMINFLQETLKTNYGNKDAVCLFVEALERYHFNYLLDVDKDRLKRINEKLYTGGILYSYFLDGAILNDSCMLFVPAGVSPSEYRRSDVCRQALRKLQVKDSCSVGLIVDSAKYMYNKAQVENIPLPLKKREDGFTYWQRELLQAVHPALKAIAKVEDETGGNPPSSVLFGMIATNTENICEGFKDDREVQMFLTLYFWKYLCYSANIDFYTGKDKTKLYIDMRR
ncbi:hypothetical protein [Bacteroides sp.]|uniref:hypothetical protein n=2 Tax=Bacteroidaceae TaxID=815 RepID=UPI00261DA7D2|nr:hypothetical protein [Bacteroides sp.]